MEYMDEPYGFLNEDALRHNIKVYEEKIKENIDCIVKSSNAIEDEKMLICVLKHFEEVDDSIENLYYATKSIDKLLGE